MNGLISTCTISRHRLRLKWSIALTFFMVILAPLSFPAVSAAQSIQASGVELKQARQLLHEGKYAEAYDLLAPMAETSGGDPGFDYLFGRAALGAGHAQQAKELFEASIAAQPDSPPAHLALGRALFALGRYAEAKIVAGLEIPEFVAAILNSDRVVRLD